jgi:deoxyribodipyrimidine photolyase-related protein
MPTTARWLFADQLGSHFLDDFDGPVVLIESRAVLRRRRFHRAKAHLVLSALRHRAADLGDRVRFIQAETYSEALDQVGEVHVIHPTSRAALAFVKGRGIEVLAPRGFETTAREFRKWTGGKPLMERFYRGARRRTGVLMEGAEPAGGRWNFDADNRQPPPKTAKLGVPDPWWPAEDGIDEDVRTDLDAIPTVGLDGPRRFAVTEEEAQEALRWFLSDRLPTFGIFEDAMLSEDAWMSHSLLSVPLGLGLLDPLQVVRDAEYEYQAGRAPLAAVEGFIRQILGWREYMWHLYWWLPDDYRERNLFAAHKPLPQWWQDLEGSDARCLDLTLRQVRETGWAHHIQRLMILGSWALQRGYDPAELTDWFHRVFVDGFDWVMLGNVVGMSQYADGGIVATKPYTSGGAYIKRMSDYCGGCRFRPDKRVGPQACPFTSGYWDFLAHNEGALAGNHRMAQPLAGMRRLANLAEVRDAADRWD